MRVHQYLGYGRVRVYADSMRVHQYLGYGRVRVYADSMRVHQYLGYGRVRVYADSMRVHQYLGYGSGVQAYAEWTHHKTAWGTSSLKTSTCSYKCNGWCFEQNE